MLKQAAARAGAARKENDLVFCTSLGGPTYATEQIADAVGHSSTRATEDRNLSL